MMNQNVHVEAEPISWSEHDKMVPTVGGTITSSNQPCCIDSVSTLTGPYSNRIAEEEEVIKKVSWYPAYEAAIRGEFESSKQKIEKNQQSLLLADVYDRTPLFIAVDYGCLPMVKQIVKSNKNSLTQTNKFNETALHLACKFGYFSILKFLMDQTNNDDLLHYLLDKQDKDGATAFHVAVWRGHLSIVEYFVKHDRSVLYSKTKNGNNVLHLASQFGHLDIVQYIMQQDESTFLIRQTNHSGYTPFHSATFFGNCNIVQYLLQFDDNDNNIACEPDNNGNTILHMACWWGHEEIAGNLLKTNHNKILMTSKNISGNIPLHFACQNGHFTIIEYLIQQDQSQIDYINNKGQTPKDLAYGDNQVSDYLRQYSHANNSASALNHLCPGAQQQQQSLLNPICYDKVISTILLYSCQVGNLEQIKGITRNAPDLLCQPFANGDDDNRHNISERMTPLHVASAYGQAHVVTYILQIYPHELGKKTLSGHLPIHLAIKYNHQDIVKIILKYYCVGMNNINYLGVSLLHLFNFAKNNNQLNIAYYIKCFLHDDDHDNITNTTVNLNELVVKFPNRASIDAELQKMDDLQPGRNDDPNNNDDTYIGWEHERKKKYYDLLVLLCTFDKYKSIPDLIDKIKILDIELRLWIPNNNRKLLLYEERSRYMQQLQREIFQLLKLNQFVDHCKRLSNDSIFQEAINRLIWS